MIHDPITYLGLWLAIGYASIFVHEIGHLIAGRLTGHVITSVGIGLSHPFLWFRIGSTILYLALGSPLQGITFAFHPQIFPSRIQKVILLSGGFLANGIVAIIGWIVASLTTWNDALGVVVGINGLLALVSLFPITVNVKSLT